MGAAESSCKILDKCGSCPQLDTPYKIQLAQKTADLKARAKDAGLPEAIVRDCVASEDRLGYRHTAKLVAREHLFLDGKTFFALGLYRPGTHEVQDIGKCAVQAADLNDVSGWLRGGVKKHKLSVYDPQAKTGALRYVVIRRGRRSRQLLVTLVCAKDERPALRALARELAEKFPRVNGVLLHLNDTEGNSIFRPNLELEALGRDIALTGHDWLEDEVAGHELRISAGSFAQVNPGVAERMYFRLADVLDLQRHETALDLYCGIGGLSLVLADRVNKVLGVEESEAAIADARANAKRNGIENARFEVGRVEATLAPGVLEGLGQVDVVSLNPSRRGCQPEALERIAALKPRAIAYMSCSPETLMRDLKILAQSGYAARLLEPHDMFPGSSHYEILALLQPAKQQ